MIISGSGMFFLSCKERPIEGSLVITQVAENLQDIDYLNEDSRHYINGSRIVALNSSKQNATINVLTEGFFSACSPDISYDGKFMIFAAQKKEKDNWQIWEMNLENLKTRLVTSSTENCVDPSYLPGERLVFSKYGSKYTKSPGFSLFTCNLDGSEVHQITFNPHSYFASTILRDGRILTLSRQLFPDQKDSKIMALRPDGTKLELFYQGRNGTNINGRSWETNNGKIIFIESDTKDKLGGNIISINYNRPLHSRVNLSSGVDGDFYAASSLSSGTMMVSYRSSQEETYALYEFDTKSNTLGETIYKDKNFNIIDAVKIKNRVIPKKLPSEVDLNIDTALLLCQDINFTDIHSEESSASTSKAFKMEVLGINSSLGIVDVEKDGSIYLKVLADTPFRIQTINENGQVVDGPGSWIYLRPNERRGCVGCHENNEQVPMNRQALATKKDPIILPLQMKEILKK